MQQGTALAIPAGLEDLWDQVGEYVAASRAGSTLAGYRSDLQTFGRWADAHHVDAGLPVAPGILCSFLAEQARTVCSGTLARRCSSIRYAHETANLVSPTAHPLVRRTMAGIRRTKQDGVKRAAPLYLSDLEAAVAALDDSPRDVRDAALLLTAFWAALRRSEAVALNWSDLTEHSAGLLLQLHKTKTDQVGAGRQIPLHRRRAAIDPVLHLARWRTMLDGADDGGAVFVRLDRWGHPHERLAGASVSEVVRRAVGLIGLDPRKFSGHSLRAGHVSSADAAGVPPSSVQLTTGHKTVQMLACYTRPRELFAQASGARFGDPDMGER